MRAHACACACNFAFVVKIVIEKEKCIHCSSQLGYILSSVRMATPIIGSAKRFYRTTRFRVSGVFEFRRIDLLVTVTVADKSASEFMQYSFALFGVPSQNGQMIANRLHSFM